MGLEGQEFPKSFSTVPGSIETPKQEKGSFLARVNFTPAEEEAFATMQEAKSLSELRVAIDAFNGISTPKKAEDLGISLTEFAIDNETLTFPGKAYLEEEGVQVVANRSMHDGVTYFSLADLRA